MAADSTTAKTQQTTNIPIEKREIKTVSKTEVAGETKKILAHIGFVKKRNGDDKEQWVAKVGEIVIGRTYAEKIPTGKFWALKNDEFLREDEIKKLPIVQRFYGFRDGKKQLTIGEVQPGGQEELTKGTAPPAIINAEEMKELETEIGKLAMKLQICVRKSHEIVEKEIGKENITEGTRATLVKSFAATLFIESSRRGVGR